MVRIIVYPGNESKPYEYVHVLQCDWNKYNQNGATSEAPKQLEKLLQSSRTVDFWLFFLLN